ncbi:MAG: hypothetical protein ACO1TE_04105 [Prosthecobacter sp.]
MIRSKPAFFALGLSILLGSCVAGPATIMIRLRNGSSHAIAVAVDDHGWKSLAPGSFSKAGCVIHMKHGTQEKTLMSGRLHNLGINRLVRRSHSKFWGGVDIVGDVFIDEKGDAWVQEPSGVRHPFP